MPKCLQPCAAGRIGVALCVLDEGHEGSCNGGAMEDEIAAEFAAYQLEKYSELRGG